MSNPYTKSTASRRQLKETDPDLYDELKAQAAEVSKARRHRLKETDPVKYDDYLRQCREKQAQLNAGPRKGWWRKAQDEFVPGANKQSCYYQKYAHAAWRCVIDGMRTRAAKKGIPFDTTITPAYMASICPTHCPVLGFELKRQSRGGYERRFSPSVDRLDPNLGYTKGNIIIVSYLANTIRTNATADQILAVGQFYKTLLADRNIVENSIDNSSSKCDNTSM